MATEVTHFGPARCIDEILASLCRMLGRSETETTVDGMIGIAQALQLSWSIGTTDGVMYKAVVCEHSPIRSMPVAVEGVTPFNAMTSALEKWCQKHPEEMPT